MSLQDEISILISARNTSGPILTDFQKQLDSTKLSVGALSVGMKDLGNVASSIKLDAGVAGLDAMTAAADRATFAIRSQIVALGDLTLATRVAGAASGTASLENTVAGAVGGRGGGGLAFRGGIGGINQSGGFNLAGGGAGIAGGSGVLGAATIPVVVAAVAGYLGLKAVNAANQYNQSIVDVVSASSQNASLIPLIQQGILNLAGGQNRFTPQQLAAAAYPIASTPAFGNTSGAFLNAAGVISQQAQPYGAASLPALAQADTGAFNAFHLQTQQQFADVADIIAKGVNVGAAEPSDFAKGVGTFAASAYAAGLTGVSGLAQASGAFAQGSLLSPKFRFDAQGLNALFQQVTGKQTAGAATAESNLGISNLFGVGAIGNAGGLPAWLQQVQAATAGPNQQAYLQAIFTRQNSLQAVRGLTGQNFGSGQEQIAKVQDYAGTVAAGAKIADQGPQAQFDQIQSQFNKDVIEVGTTISKTLTPDLALLGTNALLAAGKLGDFLGALGSGIDRLSTLLDLPVNVPKIRGDVGSAVHQAISAVLSIGNNSGAGPGVGQGARLGQSDPMRITPFGNALALGGTANPDMNLPGSGSRFYLPTASGGVGIGSGANGATEGFIAGLGTVIARQNLTGGGGPTYDAPNPTGATAPTGSVAATQAQIQTALQGIAQTNTIQTQIAANQAKENAALAQTKASNNNPLLLSDRGSINYDLATKAANPVLDAALAKLKTDLGASGMSDLNQRNYLEKYSKPVTTAENQRLVNAATVNLQSATIGADTARVNHESLSMQQAAAQRIYDASITLDKTLLKTGAYGTGKSAQLSYQDAVNQAKDTLGTSTSGNVQGRLGQLQDNLTLAGLQRNKGLQQADIAAIVAYMTANQSLLGLSSTQLQINKLQLEQSLNTNQVREQSIRPSTAGAGQPVAANYGSSVAYLAQGAVSANNQQLAAALRTIAYLEQTNRTLTAELTIARSSDAKLGVLVVQGAKAGKSTPSGANPLLGLRHIQGHSG